MCNEENHVIHTWAWHLRGGMVGRSLEGWLVAINYTFMPFYSRKFIQSLLVSRSLYSKHSFLRFFFFLFFVKAVGFRREKAIQALVSYSKNYRKGTSMETVSVLRGRSDDCSAGLWQKLLPPPLRRGKVYAPGTPPIDSFFHFRPAAVQCRDGRRDHRVDRGFTVSEEVRKGGRIGLGWNRVWFIAGRLAHCVRRIGRLDRSLLVQTFFWSALVQSGIKWGEE